MASADATTTVTVDDVRALARLAGLPLDPTRAAIVAAALADDLRLLGPLRDVEVGEIFPASPASLAHGTVEIAR